MTREVVVTSHALDRACERCPGVRAVGGLGLIRREVREALAEGRVSRVRPRWLCGDGHGVEAGVFVWPDARDRAYVVVLSGVRVVVKTTLVADPWRLRGAA